MPLAGRQTFQEELLMSWIKPEFKEVAVTLEVTAYAARR
jgi:coenzyme PQQ precursor peptide PqqA